MIKQIYIISSFALMTLISSSIYANDLYQKRVITPASKTVLINALYDGHKKVFKTTPNYKRLAMALAQINLENGHGKKIYNHNLGNVGPRRAQKVPYFILGGSKFMAHKSFLQGAVGYWHHLKVVCSGALPYFSTGRPVVAGYRLRACNYYTSPKVKYSRLLNILYQSAFKRVQNTPPSSR